MILGIFMVSPKEDKCPTCKKAMSREIEKDEKGGFHYILKCEDHGIMNKRHPTYEEIEEFNG